MTGADAFGVTPDIMNVAKQVTNGTQPLGAVIASREIYDTFMAAGGPDYMLEFPHGYTYSAHPVACAAGIAALDVLVKEDMVGRVQALAPHFEAAVHSLKGSKHVADIRNYGLAAGLTLARCPASRRAGPTRWPWPAGRRASTCAMAATRSSSRRLSSRRRPTIERLVNALGDALAETA